MKARSSRLLVVCLLLSCGPFATAPNGGPVSLATATREQARPTLQPGGSDRLPAPSPTAELATLLLRVRFETFEAEETIQSELGRLPGVQSLVVTQTEITVRYDPGRVSEEELLRAARANPEVRIE